MRDHHFQLLSPHWFGRWKERNQVRFTLGEWSGDSGGATRRAVLSIPKVYSRRSQELHAGGAHYFPAEGSEEWLCLYTQS